MTSALKKLSSIDDVEAGDVTSARPFRLQASCDAAFCEAAASRFGFVSVSSLSFAVMIKLISKECWEVSGTINAEIAQQCGVTDAILPEVIACDISERFVPQLEDHEEIDITDLGVEMLQQGKIPLSEVILQSLALAANPFPRAENAPDSFEFGPKIEKESPFSKLSQLKKH